VRREVRVDNRFFDDVDTAFRPERGPNGEPSADDFIRLNLFGIQEEVAERFDDLPVEPSAPDVRVLVLSGLMFRPVAGSDGPAKLAASKPEASVCPDQGCERVTRIELAYSAWEAKRAPSDQGRDRPEPLDWR
jgi:hypothetical protein